MNQTVLILFLNIISFENYWPAVRPHIDHYNISSPEFHRIRTFFGWKKLDFIRFYSLKTDFSFNLFN